MKLVLASRNKKKIRELKNLFESLSPGRIDVLSLDDIGFTEVIEENGNSFEENAFIKAKAVAKLGYTAVADDSGLCVDALGGEPGIYSARYAGKSGEAAGDDENIDKLLEKISAVPDEKRTARFVCAVACVYPDGSSFCVRGECEGKILGERMGCGGFGYDPVFWVDRFGRTFAQLSDEEKNSISHRGKAIRLFADKIL